MSTSFKSMKDRVTNGGQQAAGAESSPGQAQCGPAETAAAVADAPTPEQVREACRRMSRPTRFEVDLLDDWCKP